MDDSYIITNFHSLCRLCLCKSDLSISIFSNAPDESSDSTVTSKITECFEIQMDPNDGLPSRICYKCLYKVEKCSKFRLQCMQSESRLKQITGRVKSELDTSSSTESYKYITQDGHKIKTEDYIVEDSVVMVVDPSLDYDSSEESENVDHPETEQAEQDQTVENDMPTPEQFFKNVFMCQYCDQAFITMEKCKEHEQCCHDPNLPFKCIECSLVFAERSQYVAHCKQVHGIDKPYHCPECDKSFGRRSDLRKHSIVHTGIRPYQCHYCFKSFSRNTNLSKHLRIHSGHKPHVCPLCPRSFVAKGDLQRHVLVHSGMKPFACKKCPLTFGRRDKLLKHEVRHGPSSPEHNNQITQDMVVNVNPFSNLLSSNHDNEFELPRVPDHIAGESSFVNQIQKTPSTSGKQVLNSHSKQKSPISNKNKPKNIKCHQCPKRFSSLDAYKTHVSVAHIASRIFQCKICFKKFPRKRELDRHVVIHSGMKPFNCNQCHKNFTKKDKLDRHVASNECSNELVVNMPCIECGATFEKKADLVAHIKSHFTENDEDKITEGDIKQENDLEFEMTDDFYGLES